MTFKTPGVELKGRRKSPLSFWRYFVFKVLLFVAAYVLPYYLIYTLLSVYTGLTIVVHFFASIVVLAILSVVKWPLVRVD